jgi:hypothetical protein
MISLERTNSSHLTLIEFLVHNLINFRLDEQFNLIIDSVFVLLSVYDFQLNTHIKKFLFCLSI